MSTTDPQHARTDLRGVVLILPSTDHEDFQAINAALWSKIIVHRLEVDMWLIDRGHSLEDLVVAYPDGNYFGRERWQPDNAY